MEGAMVVEARAAAERELAPLAKAVVALAMVVQAAL